MISHHIYLSVALAHKEAQMEAARQAHQMRSLRRLARASCPCRSFLSRIASRLGALNYADGHGAGIARYVWDADDPQAAEIAVTVVGDRQGLGLGAELFTQLAGRGRREGIRRSTALASADNTAMTGLLRNIDAEFAGRGPGAVEYEIALAPAISTPHAYRPGAATAPGQPLAETS